MKQRFKPAKVYRYEVAENGLREQVKKLVDTFDIEIFISLSNGAPNSANNILTVNSTHSAITEYTELRETDIIEQDGCKYQIDFINIYNHLSVIFLKKIENVR